MPTITDFSRVHIDYTDDEGELHSIPQRHVVQIAANNVVSTNPALPGRPAKWKLRHVWAVTPTTGAVTNRKKIIIGSPTNPLFNDPTSGPITMDGATWKIEGRIGEKRST